jgi:hypothetical protein
MGFKPNSISFIAAKSPAGPAPIIATLFIKKQYRIFI